MASRRGSVAFSAVLGLRAVAIGGLAFLAAWLVFERGLYATGLVVLGLGLMIVGDVVRQVRAADRMLARFVDGLVVEGDERPASRAAGLSALDAAVGQALDRVSQARSERQRRIDYLETLADTVAAALFVVDEAGSVKPANQAARRLLPDARRIADFGEEAAARLSAERPGAGEVVRLADGRPMFVLSAEFAVPGGGRRRLVSLQRVTGDLDAVELRAWSDLVRVLSHEIMNSLTPILSLAESSRALIDGKDREAAEALEVIARRSAGLMTFVERYREVFDIPEPRRERVRLETVAARVEALMGSLMAEAGVAFQRHCETPNLTVEIDPALVDQALINLLKNGLEAARGRPDAAVALKVRTEGGEALIEVADNGPGLSPEDVEAVFVPFFTRKDGGSGVGLSVARQIALAHDGAVEYMPGRDGGAVFRLRLPLVG